MIPYAFQIPQKIIHPIVSTVLKYSKLMESGCNPEIMLLLALLFPYNFKTLFLNSFDNVDAFAM